MYWNCKYFTSVNIYESMLVREETVKKGILVQMKEMKENLRHEYINWSCVWRTW